MTLANTGGLTLVPGANTLTYADPSGNQVVLSLFNYANTRVSGLPTDFPEDLVRPFALGANGTPDNYVDFTLTVIRFPSRPPRRCYSLESRLQPSRHGVVVPLSRSSSSACYSEMVSIKR